MKKFLTIFCSVLALSSTGVYAYPLKTTSASLKNKTTINLNITPQNQKFYYTDCSKQLFKCQKNTNLCTAANTQTTCSTNVTTTEVTTKPTAKPTTETSTETTTQAVTKPTTEPTTETAANNNAQLSMAQQVLNLVNAERAKQNLPALKLNTALSNVAQLKSEDMKNKNYFDHTSPTYGSPFNMMKQFGINYKYAGENIAKGQKTAADVVNAWINSEGHRANILNTNFTDMGLGYVKSGSTTYWTQMFIR